MSIWTNWRNPIAVIAIAGMLTVAGIASMMASTDLSDAADAQVKIGALSSAAAEVELAWFQAMGADALAATGQARAESQGFYDGSINLYNSSKAVLSSAGISQIDQALAASDQGLLAMDAAFNETMRIAATGDIEAATDNHMNSTVALYGNVDPAVKGLALVAQAADGKLEASMNSGASKLQLLSILSLVVAALGALFAGWTAWSVYRREDNADSGSDSSQLPSMELAA